MRRARTLGGDQEIATQVWGATRVEHGVTYRETVAPGPERERVVSRLKEQFAEVAATLDPAVEALRDLIGAHKPVQFISSIAIPTAMGFMGRNAWEDDAAETVTWSAQVEYLVGLALSVCPGSGDTPPEVTEHAITLLGDIFNAARAAHMVDSFGLPSTGSVDMDWVLFMLRLENLFDRMAGYAVHLETIDGEVFDRHRDHYVARLGFSPET